MAFYLSICLLLFFQLCFFLFFFFKQKTAYGMRISDWSSDVCSSDLAQLADDLPGGWAGHRAVPGARTRVGPEGKAAWAASRRTRLRMALAPRLGRGGRDGRWLRLHLPAAQLRMGGADLRHPLHPRRLRHHPVDARLHP